MKKLLSITIIIFIMIVSTSCFGSVKKTYVDPTYYGESYGPMEIIDGLKVCLRTDGYYQVIGITDEAVRDGIVIIPQHINGIPVMGLGIPLQESYPFVGEALYPDSYIKSYIYHQKESIPLEKNGVYDMVDTDVNGGYFFSDVLLNNQIKKIYISCHHPNGNIFCIKSGTVRCHAVMDKYGIKKMRYYYGLGVNQVSCDVCYTSEDSELLLIQNYCGYSFIPNYHIISQYQYNEFLANVEIYLAEYDELRGDIDDEEQRENYKQRQLGRFQGKISNIEFHYNLTINGVEYHNENNTTNDLYWIDYIQDGDYLLNPPAPYVEGYTFLGWYTDPECTQLYDFTKPVNEIQDELVWLRLYAKWQ